MAFLKEPSCLSESKQTAIRRLNSLWRKLEANPNLQQLYRNFIHEYLDMGHMEQVFEVSEPTVAYYMPHHGVLRPDSKSTPLRTVFDASCATTTDESQRDLLRIVWKESIDDSIETYKMNRVAYGTTCAPYLAERVLKQLVMDDGHNYPLAASAVSSGMYMDDLLPGAADIYSAKQHKEQLIALFRGGGMQLHKWSCNCKELLANSEVSDGDVSLTIPDETKALGLLWRPQKDSLAFSVSANVDTCESRKITKRSVLSTTARIFDPLGLISPVVTEAKLVMQELWSTVLWTDSTIVLAWIQKDPSVLKPLVRNRVSAIQNLTEVSAWQHVPSKENRADIISRGIDPEKIQDCNLRWFGPSFLQDHSVVSPCVYNDINGNELYQREFKKTSTDPVCLVMQGQEVLPIINNCSSFTRLQRVIGWCVRFVRNAQNSLQPNKGNLTSLELFKSLMCLVKNVQVNCFAQEIKCLKRRANNELRKILKDLFNKESTGKIEDFIASEGIVWHFNPPATPHFGGLWEAGVKSLKSHLKRVVGNTVLTHEEFSTLVTQVEAVLNSRPRCNLSSDPNDDFVLTPAHFLVGSSLTALPDPDLTEVPINRLNRWELAQRLSQIFWKKWSSDYLNRLQSRVKWRKGEKIFKENEIVLVKNEDNSKTLNWNLAK
ncbi:hypothetical protein AVEN_195379-1 [Araneus ventricosus]|uniref:DUF5641 domain-containing protein n=1 Tax=Araneus ventricosus TaxID=182803 RepID=A0A4Y2DHP4_ARAVE|nr:hypothetical protein AVEN_195379-1 [Araneus ventricosus]